MISLRVQTLHSIQCRSYAQTEQSSTRQCLSVIGGEIIFFFAIAFASDLWWDHLCVCLCLWLVWNEPCNWPFWCLLICLHGLLMFFVSRCSYFPLRRFNVDCSASERLYAGVEGAFAGVTGISGCMFCMLPALKDRCRSWANTSQWCPMPKTM